jgi:hypothetical protein
MMKLGWGGGGGRPDLVLNGGGRRGAMIGARWLHALKISIPGYL